MNESPKLTPDVNFGYDKGGNRLRMTEMDGATTVREATYAYDRMHRLTSANDGTQTVSYKYDAGGLRTILTLPDGKTVQYAYDAKGQLLRLTDWASQTIRYGYDRVGRLRIADRLNYLRSQYGYDAAGRLRVLRHTAEGKTLGHFAFEVDKRGNRTQAYEALPRATNGATTLDKDSTAIQYLYGTWSTVTSYRETTNFSAVMQVAVFGRDLTLTLGTGPDFSLCDVLINGLFWNSIDNYSTANGEQAIAISLTQEGPHTVEIRNRADKNPASTGYRFRFKSLVTSASTPLYDLHTIQYTYDALSRVVGANYYPGQNTSVAATRTYAFTYDLAGNRTQANNNGTISNYTYNAVNQVTSGGVTYDTAGRMTNDGTHAYTWDRANRLLSMGSSQYLYNGMGQRIQQSVGATVTKYLLDTQPGLFQVLTETTGANVTRYVQGPMGLQQIQQASGSWQQVIPDALGSVRGVVDANNALLDSRLYAPYGEVFGPSGTSQTGYGFTGEPTDGNGLVYLRARYYSPAMGTFTGLDPLEGGIDRSGSLNRYSWVEGNVANKVDASGMYASPRPEKHTRCQQNLKDSPCSDPRRISSNSSMLKLLLKMACEAQVIGSSVISSGGAMPDIDGIRMLAELAQTNVPVKPAERRDMTLQFYDESGLGFGFGGGWGYGRSEIDFIDWEIRRRVLDPGTGSQWWQKVNERLVIDPNFAFLLITAGLDFRYRFPGEIQGWLDYLKRPSSEMWYEAHNRSIVKGYLDNENLAINETISEQLLMTNVLNLVLFAQAMPSTGVPGSILSDPRGGAVKVATSIDFFYPLSYPLNKGDKLNVYQAYFYVTGVIWRGRYVDYPSTSNRKYDPEVARQLGEFVTVIRNAAGVAAQDGDQYIPDLP